MEEYRQMMEKTEQKLSKKNQDYEQLVENSENLIDKKE